MHGIYALQLVEQPEIEQGVNSALGKERALDPGLGLLVDLLDKRELV